jgi:hypothetical protein
VCGDKPGQLGKSVFHRKKVEWISWILDAVTWTVNLKVEGYTTLTVIVS